MAEPVPLGRRLAAEGIGAFFLFATVIGSGIMAENLAGGNEAVALIWLCVRLVDLLAAIGAEQAQRLAVQEQAAAEMKDKVKVIATASGHDPVSYPAAVVAATGQKELAGKFVSFLSSGTAHEILDRYGFGTQ